MEFLKVKELAKALINADFSLLDNRDLNFAYKSLEKILSSINLIYAKRELLLEIDALEKDPYKKSLAKQLAYNIKIPKKKLSLDLINSLKKEILKFQIVYNKEIVRHNKIIETLVSSDEKSFLLKLVKYEKRDLELISQIAKITDSKNKLIKLSSSERNRKKNVEWFFNYKKNKTTGFSLFE